MEINGIQLNRFLIRVANIHRAANLRHIVANLQIEVVDAGARKLLQNRLLRCDESGAEWTEDEIILKDE